MPQPPTVLHSNCPHVAAPDLPSALSMSVMVGGLTAVEIILIVTGQGWWLLPVALLVAASCAMFIEIMLVTTRDIIGVFGEVRGEPPRARRPSSGRAPHWQPVVPTVTTTIPPDPPPTYRRIGVDGKAYGAPMDAPGGPADFDG